MDGYSTNIHSGTETAELRREKAEREARLDAAIQNGAGRNVIRGLQREIARREQELARREQDAERWMASA